MKKKWKRKRDKKKKEGEGRKSIKLIEKNPLGLG